MLLIAQHHAQAALVWMVPTQEMQQAMADQPAQLLFKTMLMVLRLPCRCFDRDDDVPQFNAGASR